MTPLQIGILGCIALVLMLLSSMPVALAMGLVGIAGYAIVIKTSAAFSLLQADLFGAFADYGLSVIPLFVFMGQVCFHAGISGRLFNAAYYWLGRLRGGMAMATVGACTVFGAICGSGPATAATMAAVALPEMRKFNYSPALAGGAVAAGGSLGMLIPPSVVFIVYGVLTEQSIGKLFLAGIVPGIVCALLFCVAIYLQCRRNPELGPKAPSSPWRDKFVSLLGISETIALFALVMGGMMAGWFTPTEGAAVGAVGSILLAAMGGTVTWRMLWRAADETMRTTCMVIVIVAGATMFGHFLAVTTIPSELAKLLIGLPIPSFMTMLLILLFFLLAGCFVDALALVFLTIPIIYPVISELGYNPIWFGVMIVLVTQMGVITPPVGVNVYVVAGVDRSIPLQTVFRGSIPFLISLFAATVLLLIFPGLATWLPDRTDASGGQKAAAVLAVLPILPVLLKLLLRNGLRQKKASI
ncbi:MAG: TRAP transporter large permease [Lentisphaerae bacterium]|jgi:C4-dicarboxylate transporter DctM subunit|nr:TRAP transporter large permease [Lentisphaerota bacterium]